MFTALRTPLALQAIARLCIAAELMNLCVGVCAECCVEVPSWAGQSSRPKSLIQFTNSIHCTSPTSQPSALAMASTCGTQYELVVQYHVVECDGHAAFQVVLLATWKVFHSRTLMMVCYRVGSVRPGPITRTEPQGLLVSTFPPKLGRAGRPTGLWHASVALVSGVERCPKPGSICTCVR